MQEDDAATVIWGTRWRTPTYDEFVELLDPAKCEWTWDAVKKGYTVKGLKTGNSIFMPVPGYRCWSDPSAPSRNTNEIRKQILLAFQN